MIITIKMHARISSSPDKPGVILLDICENTSDKFEGPFVRYEIPPYINQQSVIEAILLGRQRMFQMAVDTMLDNLRKKPCET